MREIMEQVEAELLPRAFTKLSQSFVWIDNARGWFIVDGSASRADDVIELLKQSMDMLPQMAIPTTRHFAGAAMTAWLAAGEATGTLSIDRDCELRAKTEEKAAVKYTHSNLDSEDVRNHIASGKSATRIALTYNDRVSFVLTEHLEIKRIALVDIIKEEAYNKADEGDLFAADFALYTGELAMVIAEVVEACGGLVDEISDMENAAGAAKNLSKLMRDEGASATLTDSSGNVLATFGDGPDPLYARAKSIVLGENRASISLVQRQLQIGYNRAAGLVEQMEKDGICTTMDASGERKVIAIGAAT
jgi:recombination associated protein RdgC